jgi:hypothetical protein
MLCAAPTAATADDISSAQLAQADGAAAPAGDQRARAREILSERRFRGSSVPRPFAGVLRWLGDRLQPVVDFFDDLAVRIPGGGPVLYGILAALVVLAAAGLSRRSINRRAAAAARAGRPEEAERDDPRELERAADRADAAGEWERAVRLRFRAGLLLLDARDVLVYRASLTTGEVAAAVSLPSFHRVGSDFDAIAYGGREAHEQDARASREGWQRVLEQVGRG